MKNKKNMLINLIIAYTMFSCHSIANDISETFDSADRIIFQQEKMIYLYDMHTNTKTELMTLSENFSFSPDTLIKDSLYYIEIFNDLEKYQFQIHYLSSYTSLIYMLNSNCKMHEIGQRTYTQIDNNTIRIESIIDEISTVNIKKTNIPANIAQFDFVEKSNQVKEKSVYSLDGNLFLFQNDTLTLLLQNQYPINLKAHNGLYCPNIAPQGDRFCFAWKEKKWDLDFYIWEYTFTKQSLIKTSVKGYYPYYSSNGKYILIRSGKNYTIYSIDTHKTMTIKNCKSAYWYTTKNK
jgi:hypothetical protein